MEGRKDDAGKVRWDLVQPMALEEYARVLTHGAVKYAPDNWRHVSNPRARYFAALLRHVWAWWLGETHDPESGYHHLAHAMCCVAFLLEPELESGTTTVRPKPGTNVVRVTINEKEVARGKTK